RRARVRARVGQPAVPRRRERAGPGRGRPQCRHGGRAARLCVPERARRVPQPPPLMARGDFIGGSESLANAQGVDIRPPEGETWLITGWGGTATSNVSLLLTDGTLLATMRGFSVTAGPYRFKQLALFVTHDLYAAITNGSGSTQTVSWTGVVWKEAGTPPGPGDGVGAIQGGVAFGAVLT